MPFSVPAQTSKFHHGILGLGEVLWRRYLAGRAAS